MWTMRSTRVLLLSMLPVVASAMSVALESSAPDGTTVGTNVTWTATAQDAAPGTLWYRFRARAVGSNFRTIIDFGPKNTFDWAADEHEGLYEIETVARNVSTGEEAAVSEYIKVSPQITGNQPAIQPTANSMVFLYSAPGCSPESRMRVEFGGPGLLTQYTPWKPCNGLSMNFYLGGLRGDSVYTVQHTIDTGTAFLPGPKLQLETPSPPADLASQTVIHEP